MKDKILVFLSVCVVILFFVVVCMFYYSRALKTEKNALNEDVLRMKQSLTEMEKQNEVLLEAKKENEQFKQDLSNDSDRNLDISPAPYILNRMHAD